MPGEINATRLTVVHPALQWDGVTTFDDMQAFVQPPEYHDNMAWFLQNLPSDTAQVFNARHGRWEFVGIDYWVVKIDSTGQGVFTAMSDNVFTSNYTLI